MPPFPQLKSPPIIEAQMNFHADASAGWASKGTPEEIVQLFPSHSEVRRLQQVEVNLGGAEDARMQSSVTGFFLRKAGDPAVYMARRDGFAYSRLAPYDGWESFKGAALAAWEHYRKEMQTGELHTVGLRYINRIEVPRRDYIADREAFFTIAPRVPQGTGWKFAGVSHHSVYVTPDQRFHIQVNFGVEAPVDPETAPFMLDVMVSPRVASGVAEVEPLLLEMRELKNQAFFSIVTEAVWKRYL
jgi:uncharacterized protein (TIGR04255 family)